MFQNGCAAGGGHRVPFGLCGDRVLQGFFDGGAVGGLPATHGFAPIGRVGHADHAPGFGVGGEIRARHQRHGAPAAGTGGVDLFCKCLQLRIVGEVEAHGIVPVVAAIKRDEAAIQMNRQRNARMRKGVECGDRFDRIVDQIVDRNRFVGDAVDEAGVGAVFQQTPDQIRQQVFVRTHRRVHAAGHVQTVCGNDFGVEIVAHAV